MSSVCIFTPTATATVAVTPSSLSLAFLSASYRLLLLFSLCHSLFVTHLYLSLLSCRPPPGVPATPSSSPLLIAANLLSSPKPSGNGSSQPPAINLLHSAAPILGQWRLPSLHKLPAYPSKAGPEN